MIKKFAVLVESLHPSFERLMAMEPIKERRFPKPMPTHGVYLFSEGDKHLYVGRSNSIRKRYGLHCNVGSGHLNAAFAFRLAREKTGKIKASYKAGNESRNGLINDPEFKTIFDGAKARIRSMDFRFVEETDPLRQALLEIYCAVALDTPYNDFNNH